MDAEANEYPKRRMYHKFSRYACFLYLRHMHVVRLTKIMSQVCDENIHRCTEDEIN